MKFRIERYTNNSLTAIAYVISSSGKRLIGVDLNFDTGKAVVRSRLCDYERFDKAVKYVETQDFIISEVSDSLLYRQWLQIRQIYNRGK